ncbi:hypothetical protein [Phycicoccus ginsengisoli]
MTEHHDHRRTVQERRPTAGPASAPRGLAPPPRLLVDGAGDGASHQLAAPR